jgi:hypothetical protein
MNGYSDEYVLIRVFFTEIVPDDFRHSLRRGGKALKSCGDAIRMFFNNVES